MQTSLHGVQVFSQQLSQQLNTATQGFQSLTNAAQTHSRTRAEIEREINRSITQSYRQELQAQQDANRQAQQAMTQAFRQERQQQAQAERDVQRALNQAHQQGLQERRTLEESINYQITQSLRTHAEQRKRIQRELAQEQRLGIVGAPTSSPAAFGQFAQLQGFITLAQESERQLTSLDRAFLRVGSAIQSMGAFLLGSALLSLPFVLASLTRQIVDAGAKLEGLRVGFTTVAGGAERGAVALQFARQTAIQLGLDVNVLQERFLKLTAATQGTNLRGVETQRLFTAMAGAARVLQLSSEQTRLAFIALEQIVSKGKLSAEELRQQLGEHLPGAFQIAARAMGVTTKQLDEMLKKGQIMADDFLPRFRRQLDLEFGKGVEAAGSTAGAAFQKFFTELSLLKERLAGTGILELMKNLAEQATNILRLDREATERQQRGIAQAGAEALAGKPVAVAPQTLELAAGATQAEINRATRLAEDLFQLRRQLAALEGTGAPILQLTTQRKAQLEEEFRALNNVIRARQIDNVELDAGALAGARYAEAQKRAGDAEKKALEDVRTLRQELTRDLKRLDEAAQRMPEIYNEPKRGLADITKTAKELDKILEKHSLLVDHPEVRQFTKDLNSLAGGFNDETDAAKAAEKATREAEAQRRKEQALVTRLTDDYTDLEKRIRILSEAMTTANTPGQINALASSLNKLKEQRDKLLGTDPLQDPLIKGLDAIAEADRQFFEQDSDLVKNMADEHFKAQQKITEAVAKESRSRLQIAEAELAEDIQFLEERSVRAEDIARFTNAKLARAREDDRRHLQTELEKQQKEYEKLAQSIERPLSTVFQNLLSGSKTLFDSIKQLFIKLLADLAAAALTNKIIIPAIIAVVGGGGTAAGGISGGSGGSGGAGAEGVGGDILGTVLGLGQQGLSISSSLSGGGGNSSGILGTLGKIPAVQNLLDTILISGGLTAGSAAGLGGVGGGAAGALFGGSGGAVGVSGAAAGLGGAGSIGAGVGAGTAGAGALSGGSGAAAGAIGGLSAGTAITGVGTGIGVGLALTQLNEILGLTDLLGQRGSNALAGAGGGAAGGAIIGSAFGPWGTAIGAIVGTIVGALGGSLFGGSKPKVPEFAIEETQPARVSFLPDIGLEVTQPFALTQARIKHLGKETDKLVQGINTSMTDIFTNIVQGFRGVTPQLQPALVAPLNAIADNFSTLLETVKTKGKNIQANLEEFFNESLPKAIESWVTPLQEGVRKLDPIIRQFTDVIAESGRILQQLAAAQAQQHLDLAQQIYGLEEALFSPAQVFLRRQEELRRATEALGSASPPQRLVLIPIIQQLVEEIFTLGRTPEVLGQDPQLVRDLQTEIAGILTNLQGVSADAFGSLQTDVEEQISLAERQIEVLVASLNDLGSIDQVVGTSADVLRSIHAALAPFDTNAEVAIQVQTSLLAGQFEVLQGIGSIGQSQLVELHAINEGVGRLQGLAGGISSSTGGDSSEGGIGGEATGGEATGGEATGGGGSEFGQYGRAYIPRNGLYFLHQGEQVIAPHETHNNGDTNIIIQGGAFTSEERLADEIIRRIEQKGGRLRNTRIQVTRR